MSTGTKERKGKPNASAQGVVLASTLESLDSHISVTVEVEPSDLAARANNLAVVLASLNTFYEDR